MQPRPSDWININVTCLIAWGKESYVSFWYCFQLVSRGPFCWAVNCDRIPLWAQVARATKTLWLLVIILSILFMKLLFRCLLLFSFFSLFSSSNIDCRHFCLFCCCFFDKLVGVFVRSKTPTAATAAICLWIDRQHWWSLWRNLWLSLCCLKCLKVGPKRHHNSFCYSTYISLFFLIHMFAAIYTFTETFLPEKVSPFSFWSSCLNQKRWKRREREREKIVKKGENQKQSNFMAKTQIRRTRQVIHLVSGDVSILICIIISNKLSHTSPYQSVTHNHELTIFLNI